MDREKLKAALVAALTEEAAKTDAEELERLRRDVARLKANVEEMTNALATEKMLLKLAQERLALLERSEEMLNARVEKALAALLNEKPARRPRQPRQEDEGGAAAGNNGRSTKLTFFVLRDGEWRQFVDSKGDAPGIFAYRLSRGKAGVAELEAAAAAAGFDLWRGDGEMEFEFAGKRVKAVRQ